MESKEIPVINLQTREEKNKRPTCYLKDCKYCREKICMIRDSSGIWRPYESWSFGNCSVGEFILHKCK